MNYRIHSLKQVVLFLTVITFLGLVTIVRAPSFAESFDFGEKEAALSMTDPRYALGIIKPPINPVKPVITYPSVKVTYNNNQSYSGNYYRTSRTATIRIVTGNWTLDDFYIGVRYSPYYFQDFGQVQKQNITFIPVSGLDRTYEGKLTFKKDGHYGFVIEGPTTITGQVSFSDYFLIDSVPPVIELTFDKEKEEGGFYSEAVTGTLLVTENNFDEKDVKISIKHKPPGQNDFMNIAVSGPFKNETVTSFSKMISFTEEGVYKVDITYKDPVGYSAKPINEEFSIDKAAPVLSVQFDNNEAATSNFYNKIRKATIVVEETNFDPELVEIEQSASRNGEDVEPPVVSDWRSDGSKHTAEILYDADGEYSLAVSCTDIVGRQSEPYKGEKFVIDLSPPSLTVTGIPAGANGQTRVAPIIEYNDSHLVPESVDIQLEGQRRGVIRDIKDLKAESTGGRVEYMEFPHTREMDDLYTLTVNMADKANNTVSETIRFSVNRFGSTYALSDETKALAGTYVKKAPDVSVTETNVNKLTMNRVTLFKDNLSTTLKEGVDYSLEQNGDADTFYQYSYRVHGKNFLEDGMYRLSFSSKDSAGNLSDSSSALERTDISFVVDNTAPIVSFLNLEDGKAYEASEYDVIFSADDNAKLASVTLYLDGETVREWSGSSIDELVSRREDFLYTLKGDSKSARHLRVVCVDAAGNQTEKEVSGFYVTTNWWVNIMNNEQIRILVYVGAALACLLTAFMVYFILSRRSKKRRKLHSEPSHPGVPMPARSTSGPFPSPYPSASMPAQSSTVPLSPQYPAAPLPTEGSTVMNPYVYRGKDKEFPQDMWENKLRSDQPVTNQLYDQLYQQSQHAGEVGESERDGYSDASDPSKLDFGETTLLAKRQTDETTILDEHRG